jgi:hypothetical protein
MITPDCSNGCGDAGWVVEATSIPASPFLQESPPEVEGPEGRNDALFFYFVEDIKGPLTGKINY